jgi:hypothetical protein
MTANIAVQVPMHMRQLVTMATCVDTACKGTSIGQHKQATFPVQLLTMMGTLVASAAACTSTVLLRT